MKSGISEIDRPYRSRLEHGKPWTGRTVLIALLGAFVVIFVANFALIYTALGTLHGEEVENSYDASQIYNQKIAAARAQDQLGWKVDVTTRQENGGVRVIAEVRDRDGQIVPGLAVSAKFLHPIDRFSDRVAALADDGGEYEGFAADVRPGKWTLDLEAKLNGERKFFSENKLELKANAE